MTGKITTNHICISRLGEDASSIKYQRGWYRKTFNYKIKARYSSNSWDHRKKYFLVMEICGECADVRVSCYDYYNAMETGFINMISADKKTWYFERS